MLDVREGADYYGPDGPYKVMAGRDASKAFAMMSLKLEDATADLSGVSPENLKILDDWYAAQWLPAMHASQSSDIVLACARARLGHLFSPDLPHRTLTCRYDKLTKKYPTVGCCAGNDFGYSLSDIDIASEALKTGKSDFMMAEDQAGR